MCIFSILMNIMIALSASYILFLLFGNIPTIKFINAVIIISAIIYSIQEVYEDFSNKKI